jgi:hypothetical protein
MTTTNKQISPALQTGSHKARGRPFPRGNSGRPLGAKNKTTRFLEELVEGEGEKLIHKLLERALGGDPRCLLYCVDRLLPQRRGRPVDLQLPQINSVQDVPLAMAAVTNGINAGKVTAEDASHLVHLFDSYVQAVVASDIAVRIEKVESVLKMQMKSWNRR